MIYLWGIFAGVLTTIAEVFYKEVGEFWKYWYVTVPLAIGINYSIFRIVQLAPNLISAFIVFGACTFMGRMFWTLYSHHPISNFTWTAGVLYLLTLVLREMGARWG